MSLVSSSGTNRDSFISFCNFDAEEHISLKVMAEEHTKLREGCHTLREARGWGK